METKNQLSFEVQKIQGKVSFSNSAHKIIAVPIRVLDKQYFYTEVQIDGPAEDQEMKALSQVSDNNSFLMVLDRSGSMAGGPWKALVEGAQQVATRIYEQKEFTNFLTIFFNNQVNAMTSSSLEDFNQKISRVKAGSTTNFSETFQSIISYCDKKNTNDLTVLFLTDGKDTCFSENTVNENLERLKDYLKVKEITSRFFTIGLSNNHNSILLSKIAQTGSELGNFFYVDYSSSSYNYKDHIKDCLVKTFEMGAPSNSIIAHINLGTSVQKVTLPIVEEEKKEGEEFEQPERQTYHNSVILESLPEGEVEVKINESDESLFVKPEIIENPK